MNESRGLVAGDTRGRQEDLVLGGERQAGGQGARGQGAGGQGAGGQGAGGQGLPPQHLNKMVHKPLFCRLDNDAGPDYRSLILYISRNSMLKGVPGLLVDDPLGDVYKIPTREEISRKKFKVRCLQNPH